MGGILILVFCLLLAYVPSFLLWWLAWKCLPRRYTLTLSPSRMTGLCMLLAFLTAASLNLELKSGVITFTDILLELTLAWTFILLPIGILKMSISRHKR